MVHWTGLCNPLHYCYAKISPEENWSGVRGLGDHPDTVTPGHCIQDAVTGGHGILGYSDRGVTQSSDTGRPPARCDAAHWSYSCN